ncbi:hypothetical protein F8568_014045 [Actinomadura sp. LD22]|uniref:Uncharacterized protein n=1 Tax=Actinomadura physcomitrii TaxID=2650748 RepID=A0A6I4MCH5_9ACTN|nr:hypothetical protein [Actinomadura physcomitrii]MWA01481.1 hypothetical protein [Actinomadura physcomitrii]
MPWFVASTGDPLKPCHDIAGTVAEIAARLGPLTEPADTKCRRRRVAKVIRKVARKER